MTPIEIILLVLVFLLIVSIGFLIWLIRGLKKPKKEEGQDTAFSLLFQQMNELTRTLDNKLGENTQKVHDSLNNQWSESQKLIKEITRELTEVKETGRQMVSFADELANLQDILKNPKHRGVLGEYYLETLLKNSLPPSHYKMQYGFSNGEAVDAVVFVKDKIIPIDSKFSLENYNRMSAERNPAEKERLQKVFLNDLKNRIQETAKYIRPAENTLDFAFMFIPHEAIYYDLLVNKIGGASPEDNENLIQRAASKYKVIIVSPTSFLAYLQTVLHGLKAMKIEETAKEIIKRVGDLSKHLKTYEESHTKLGNSLASAIGHYNHSRKEFQKMDKDVLKITGSSPEISPLVLEKPELVED